MVLGITNNTNGDISYVTRPIVPLTYVLNILSFESSYNHVANAQNRPSIHLSSALFVLYF